MPLDGSCEVLELTVRSFRAATPTFRCSCTARLSVDVPMNAVLKQLKERRTDDRCDSEAALISTTLETLSHASRINRHRWANTYLHVAFKRPQPASCSYSSRAR